MARHVAVASPKGGVGKTLIALQLAGHFAVRGERVCLVDHDPQGSCLIFGKVATNANVELPFVPTTAMVSGFDTYIHDYPPGLADTYAPCRIVVVPTLLDAASYLVHKRGLRHFQDLGLRVIPVAQRVRTDRKEQRDLLKHFQDGVVLRDRALYANCYGKGLTVASARGLPHLGLAQSEIERLAQAVDGGGK
ncbi:ParA family protein [Pseudoxanthomonas daejeonensis]|uniref:CobQ/CobB/MinD/ParA nucleotide binding domain-containing protein n=1 Tax=Pseudoxanthomonas daejeonensis TaxID=266062 RepID=A0ABQ6Z9F6_9GAMM|nr:ParA family protein [Pseudoxanthomonas daejeonensis]KAF1696025.1 hypothetical protein CSC65_05880 [Pseudoxanthomonas daejeonensis]